MRRTQWCIHFQFLRKKVHVMMNMMKMFMNPKKRVSRSCLIRLAEHLHVFFVFVPWNQSQPATSLNETLRFKQSARLFEWFRGSIPRSCTFHFALHIFSSNYSHVHPCLFHIFLFFHHSQKIITHEIQLQIAWFFFWIVHHVVYFFMDIFSRFMHGWILKMLRVCFHMSLLAPCLLFWSWNDDA